MDVTDNHLRNLPLPEAPDLEPEPMSLSNDGPEKSTMPDESQSDHFPSPLPIQTGPLGIQEHHPREFQSQRRKSSTIGPRRRSSATDAGGGGGGPGNSSSTPNNNRRKSSIIVLERVRTAGGSRKWWKFTLRDWDDEEDQDWWFASTAIPLLAATIGPLANVLSIAALVTSWRMCLVTGVGSGAEAARCDFGDGILSSNGSALVLGPELQGQDFADPRWCYWLNVVSLIAGFIGNFFLLCNFTNRIRYIVALPVTIVMWYVATGILIGITLSMEIYEAPVRPQQTYTQGFWYAVIAACMYMICAMLLMVNMLGYFLGHYPQHFTLTESQRTLILQTMLFFLWLAGGGAVFSRIENLYGSDQTDWTYVNSLYFCDVTILTVGFGDLYPTSDAGRGIVFPYSVGGIIMLGLMVSSITKFAGELGSEKVVRRHIERSRSRTVGRTVTASKELEKSRELLEGERPVISPPFNPIDKSRPTTIGFIEGDVEPKTKPTIRAGISSSTFRKVGSWVVNPPRRVTRKPKLLLLREEKDRFDAMRRIQRNTAKFKNWYALSLSITAFGLLWCVGAVVFWRTERDVQGMTYFRALYFCYVSLLTIGYGDLAPKSNAGRPFFVLWSLIAVPTMTILVSDLGETVINKFKQGTFRLADFTVLPQKGVWREFLNRHEGLLVWLQRRKDQKDVRKRLEEGFQYGPAPEPPPVIPTIDELAGEEPSDQELARKLAGVIRRVATDAKTTDKKLYSYEEWVEFTQLIRFTVRTQKEREIEDEEEGMVEWDWIGEDSPMMAHKTEPEFVLDRLCESMNRLVKRVAETAAFENMALRQVPQKRRVFMLDEKDDEDEKVGPTNGKTADATVTSRPRTEDGKPADSPTTSSTSEGDI